EFFHCETITVRSQRYDWEISPHVHPALSQLLFVSTGSIELRLGLTERRLHGPVLVCAPRNIVHGFRFGDEVDGDVLTFSAELRGALRSSAAGDPGLVGGALVLTPAVDLLARLAPLVEQLRMECSGHEQDRITAAEWLVGLLLLQVGRVAVDAGDDGSAVSGRPQRFRDLVDRHFREHRPIAFYAAALAMTERSLTRLCRARFHCSPMHYVHRRLLLEAQRQLTYGSTSIARIAEDLGFADPSYFTRFYRRMTGKLPSTARRQAL
ncbi:MAG: hypothetical protein ABS87_02130, partial [Sphingomonas sp. SCN 67-18]